MKHRPVFIRILAIIFGLSLGLVFVAVLKSSRKNDPPASVRRISNPGQNQITKFIYHQTPFYYPFKARSTHIHAQEPFSEVFEFGARHNSQGFRTPEYTLAHPPNTFRILVLGDSITWGQGVKLEETFPQVLQSLLHQKCPEVQYELIGMGVRGHRLADNLMKLLVHGQYLKPDLVLIQVCVNDLDFYDYVSISHFQGVAKQKIKSPVEIQKEIWKEGTLDWKIFSECLDAIEKWSQVNSVPVGFLFFPVVDAIPAGHNFEHYDVKSFPWLRDFEKVIDEVRSRKYPTIFLMDQYREKAGDSYLAVSKTDGHPNVYAHRLAAEAIAPFLFREKLVKCSRSGLREADIHWKEEDKLRKQAARDWLQLNASYEKQLEFFQAVKELYPNDPWVTMELAFVYHGMRKWEKAFETYLSLNELAAPFAAPWYHMSLCIQDRAQKKNLLKRMIQITPDHNFAMQDLAQLYLEENKVSASCPLLERLMQIPQSQEQFEKSKDLYEKHRCSELR